MTSTFGRLALFCALVGAPLIGCENDYEKLTRELEGPGGNPPDASKPTPTVDASASTDAGTLDAASPDGGSEADSGGGDAAAGDAAGDAGDAAGDSGADAAG